MPLQFRFRPVPFVAAVLVAALGISLGQWQTRRGDEKAAIEARIAQQAQKAQTAPELLGPAALPLEQIEYARVTVRGRFVAGWPLYLDNRPLHGKAGFIVLMPLQLAGSSQHVLVARGWVERNMQDRTALPALHTPEGEVSFTGLVRHDAGHVMQLGTAPAMTPRAILQNATPAEVGAASGLAMLPYLVEQLDADGAQDGLLRDWPAPSLGIDKHRGYAFQWYGLAATALLFFVVTGFRRARTKPE